MLRYVRDILGLGFVAFLVWLCALYILFLPEPAVRGSNVPTEYRRDAFRELSFSDQINELLRPVCILTLLTVLVIAIAIALMRLTQSTGTGSHRQNDSAVLISSPPSALNRTDG